MSKEMETIRNHLSDKQWVLFCHLDTDIRPIFLFQFTRVISIQTEGVTKMLFSPSSQFNFSPSLYSQVIISIYKKKFNTFYWCKSLSNSCYLHLKVALDILCHTNDLHLRHTFISQNYKIFVNVSYGKHCLESALWTFISFYVRFIDFRIGLLYLTNSQPLLVKKNTYWHYLCR